MPCPQTGSVTRYSIVLRCWPEMSDSIDRLVSGSVVALYEIKITLFNLMASRNSEYLHKFLIKNALST
jgi:hypothetical protein